MGRYRLSQRGVRDLGVDEEPLPLAQLDAGLDDQGGIFGKAFLSRTRLQVLLRRGSVRIQDRNAIATLALGRVHGDIGANLQIVGVDREAWAKEGEANARARRDHMAIERVGGRGDRIEDLLRNAQRLRRLGMRKQRRELIAADPTQDVGTPQPGLEALANATSRRSPTWWPRLSLTSLKLSRSNSSSAAGWP